MPRSTNRAAERLAIGLDQHPHIEPFARLFHGYGRASLSAERAWRSRGGC